MSLGRRLIIVSNRLPIVIEREEDHYRISPGSGGLVTALAPVLENEPGMWIGWAGTDQTENIDELLRTVNLHAPYSLEPIFLSAEERQNFYYGFANEIVWPLFHDLQSRCNFDPNYWYSYQRVNLKYAETIARHAREEDFVWVHDYHLMNVGTHLRSLGVKSKLAFFLHIPFPSTDIFSKLPWRLELLRAVLDFDLVGFQTERDRLNFMHCLHGLMRREVETYRGEDSTTAEYQGRRTEIASFPISIDVRAFAELAASTEVSERAEQIRHDLAPFQIVLGVDRLDYTKGIPERLKAFGSLLARFPELQRRIVLVQVVVPSREHIPEYQQLREEVERLVSEINGRYTHSGWVPIHYMHRSLERPELLAHYRASDIALITPLKDGMNLVAKEYCASQSEEHPGVLILSEFAGSAAQMRNGAILVNPYDLEGVGEAIYRAFAMSGDERRRQMRKLRRNLERNDIFHWADSFFHAAFAVGAGKFRSAAKRAAEREPRAASGD